MQKYSSRAFRRLHCNVYIVFRWFDADYDLASVNREKIKYLNRMKLLFVDGHVLTAGSVKIQG